MNIRTRMRHVPTRGRRSPAVGSALAVVLLITTACEARDESATLSNQAAPGGAPETSATDMTGMAGMAMGDGGSIRLTADQIRTFGVTFGSVEERMLEDVVRTVGIVRVDETRLAAVTLKFSGYAEQLHVNITGMPVGQGQPLVEMFSPDLVAAQEELLLAARLEAELSGSVVPGLPTEASLVAAARQRLRLLDITDAQIEEVLQTGRARRTLTLYAPASGVVIEKNVVVGQAVSAGQLLYTIADLSEVWVEADLREAEAEFVRLGDSATVEFASYPGRPRTGRVEYIYPTLQEQARTLKARIAISNPDGQLRPGMYATVRIQAPVRLALTVSSSAILDTGEQQVVFVDLGGGRVLPQDVEVGRVSGELTEVLAGLEPGQRVVTSAQYLLDSESNVAEVMRSMIGMMNTSDMGSMDMQGADMNGMTMPPPEP